MAFIPAKRSDIRIGLYIKLPGSWFSHPFPESIEKSTGRLGIRSPHSR